MRSFPFAVATVLSLSVGALAADPPNLLGDWTRTVLYSAKVGEHPGYPPAAQTEVQQWPRDGSDNED
jgi:hypothetical protein